MGGGSGGWCGCCKNNVSAAAGYTKRGRSAARRNEKNKKWAEEKTLLKENKHLPAEGKLKTENPHGMQGQCKGRTSKLGKQASAPVRANNPNRL